MSGPVVLALRALLAVCLYAFLGWAFYSLWRDIKQQGTLLAARRAPSIDLTITQNVDKIQIRHFHRAEITVGRDPTCDCSIEDDSISARHARLSYHHNQWWLEDLESTNGTLLNQHKLSMPTVVISNDEFICGETSFVITMADQITVTDEKNRREAR
jgi:hypothetical protein